MLQEHRSWEEGRSKAPGVCGMMSLLCILVRPPVFPVALLPSIWTVACGAQGPALSQLPHCAATVSPISRCS